MISAMHRFKSMTGVRRVAGVAVSVLLLAAAPAAVAQETFELTPAGEFEPTRSYPPDTPEGRIQAIRKLLAEKKPDKAKARLDAWLQEFPNHPWRVEAYLLRGDALVQRGDLYEALFDYEVIVKQYHDTEHFFTALEREFLIARELVNGWKRAFMLMPIIPADGDGVELLLRIQMRAPDSDVGEKAVLELGEYYFRRGEMAFARDTYESFLELYPRSLQIERAMFRLIQSNLGLFKGPRFDPTGLLDAAERLRVYAKQYPVSAQRIGVEELLVRIHESLALKLYYSAQWYEKRNERVSAVYMYRRTLTDYPGTSAAKLAVKRLTELGEDVVPVEAPSSDQIRELARPSDADQKLTEDPTQDMPRRSGYDDGETNPAQQPEE